MSYLHPTTIHAVRSLGQLYAASQPRISLKCAPDRIESQFANCLATFPSSCHIGSTQSPQLDALASVLLLQNARLILHRRNLSTLRSIDECPAVIAYCVTTARFTAALIGRISQAATNESGHADCRNAWAGQVRSLSSATFCLHLWRCTLFLCYSGHYTAAMTCVQASSAVGDLCAVNAVCGRYLDFFLGALAENLHPTGRHQPETDEAMLAYVSGDLQRSHRDSWSWPSDEGETTAGEGEDFSTVPRRGSQPRGADNWSGWHSIETRLHVLHQGASHDHASTRSSMPPLAVGQTPATGRISIASII